MTDKQILSQKLLMTEKNICSAINSNGIDNEIGVPDFIVARYLMQCLCNLKTAIHGRNKYKGISQKAPTELNPRKNKGASND